MKSMLDVDRAYTAGIIDGEGCFNIRHQNKQRSYYPIIQVCNTDFKMISYLLSVSGIGAIVFCKGTGNRKDHYKWTVARMADVYDLLDAIYPYLITKKEKADLLYKLREIKRRPLVRRGISRGRLITSDATLKDLRLIAAKMAELNFRGYNANRVNSEKLQNGQLRAELVDCARQPEGVEVKAEETIMPISALPERDDMTRTTQE
jgi:hypothetical protein